ncbi:transposase [Methylovirgula sp. 4M-Z18]|uniref:transposase n=2 Tax=Methylovirgula sp. 4M-Z18 TaxID=2293567 RepID=UPI001314F353
MKGIAARFSAALDMSPKSLETFSGTDMMAGESQALALAAELLTQDWRARLFPYAACIQMAVTLIEAILNAELNHHMEYEARARRKNTRNGHWKRSIWSDVGEKVVIRMPRDRAGRFEPLLLPLNRQHFYGFTDRILTTYAHGRHVAEFDEIISDLYDFQLPRDLAPRVIDAVLSVIRDWQNRPLAPLYSIMLFGIFPTTTRERELTRTRPVHFGLGFQPDGSSDLLGLWVNDPSDDDLWTQVTTDLTARGAAQISLVVTDEVQDVLPRPHLAFDVSGYRQCEVRQVCRFSDLKRKRKPTEPLMYRQYNPV